MSQEGGKSEPDANEKEQRNQKLRLGLEAMFCAQEIPSEKRTDIESDGEEVPPSITRDEDRYRQVAEAILRIDTKSKIIEINNIRLFSVAEIELDKLTECTSLSLRKNLLHDLIPFPEDLADRLDELDLFDNKIRKLNDFFETVTVPGDPPTTKTLPNAYKCLTKLDLSYNQIREIGGLDSIGGTLRELYLVENKIKEVKNLDSLVNLELLELGGNRLRAIGSGLEKLTKLKQLWLGKNKISSIGTALHKLVSLEILSLQANRITSVDAENFLGAKANPNLREVYLSENGLTSVGNVRHLSTIKIIDFSFNSICSIDAEEINPQTMPKLEEFWLTDGNIADWEEVGKLSGFTSTLKTVYLERNPIEEDKRYRDKVYMYLPFLVQIDSWPIVNKGNLEADRKRKA
ncbi:protein phosphatase 1, regulatory subunit, putative [Trypanosoma equiperdum]|uniref:Protein phosphatase 1, regulatory subunit, putative n=2 Tax=Trypanozoon TaxID=39700 RepID=Q57VV4_TRYB2|nr:protein phosphatase 1, regulatory subunit, putative [Trypanosoma brucei brucei TREU927]AAX70260.1 protein phosphatase 1, regulatory subunit, putative [Trypanosoma brucei]AAZ11174.1 protein phosphatase 1, regulatory subunit, putative [Trypanosoma brucei brucei TREU927]SCU64463.1 protein phosphatase 1, regulatory subunit, putative [Trypanosoma equiperdum]